jgi:predicted O-methyltransferase YrrM
LDANWKFPADVRGWLSEEEGRALARLASGKRVLEIGSFEGRSTICMAQTASLMMAVDPFDGRATPLREPTLENFRANLARYAPAAPVEFAVGTSDAVVPGLPLEYDLVFIDGAHDYRSASLDAALAAAKLAPGGALAFHDYRVHPGEYNGGWDPGVTQAVNELLADGWYLDDRHGTVAVLRRKDAAATPQAVQTSVPPATAAASSAPVRSVFLAVPTRGSVIDEAIPGLFKASLDQGTRINLRILKTGMVALNFNSLWAEALNGRTAWGTSHWAMHHADIQSRPGWLDELIAEMERVGADVLSVVVPIKDERGLTTTAVGDDGQVLRRLTMHEVYGLHETFEAADLGLPEGQYLMVNTGLWVCRFDVPWVAPPVFPGFYFTDGIFQLPDGSIGAGEISEDWNFSSFCARQRLRVFATRKVPVIHHGGKGYPNTEPWGTWARDLGDQNYLNSMHCRRQPRTQE